MAQRHSTDRQTLDQTTQTDTRKNKKSNAQERNFLTQRIWHIWFCPTRNQRFAKPKEPNQAHPPPNNSDLTVFFRKRKKILHNQKTVTIFADQNTLLVSKYENGKRRNCNSRHHKRC